MILKINMLALLMLFICADVDAKDARNLWKTIPDSLVQSIDKVRRLEMLDLIDYKVKAEVDNRLGSQSVMDTLTADFLHVSISKSSSLSMRLLPTQKGDTIMCMVKTYNAPMAESQINFYDLSWHQLDASKYLPFSSLSESIDSLIEKPDTMSGEKFDQLTQNIIAILVSAETTVADSKIELVPSLPMISKDYKDAMTSIIRKCQLIWNGEKYIYKVD